MSSCVDCKYSGGRIGYEDYPCKRHSPVIEKVHSCHDIREFIPVWPIMKASDWCGDFEIGSQITSQTTE